MTLPTYWLNTNMAYKSKFIPRYTEKYLGNTSNIVCRSSWERRFARYCDDTPAVKAWASEEFFIPYSSPVDGRIHRYFPDFYMEVATTNGTKTYVIEVKPKAQTAPPVLKKRRSRRFLREAATFAVNQAKWAAAEAHCKAKGWTFMVMTEDHLFGAS